MSYEKMIIETKNKMDRRPTLFMMVGIVASGKSTYVEAMLKEVPKLVSVHPDSIRKELTGNTSDQSQDKRVFELVRERIKEALKASKNVVYDATNYNRKNRKDWLTLAKSLGCNTTLIVIKTTFSECRRRNAARKRVVPDFVLDRQIKGYQEPSLEDEKVDFIIEC